ncbi:HET-domain-containing protein [Aspergillus sclerotiicarbonarius CBS 121057]|uniref:HET-domain-containing protein n=1 Tax=Aspergillus sclerotiicarbonarius (strain CBS 121057 / IBT 28362) TaxID=1448318 RepID=A0A319F9J4_ASPSB|nr:HET-domain-containing protein [Aspergillus sclerotiicarbonarius CBS 121057]
MQGLTLDDCELLFHKQPAPLPGYEETFCTFCAHLRIEFLVRISDYNVKKFRSRMRDADYIHGPLDRVEVSLGQISDIQARKKSCFLCARVAAILTREGSVDRCRDVYLRISSHRIAIMTRNREGNTRIHTTLDGYRPYSKPEFTFDCSVGDIAWPTVTKWVEGSLRSAKESSERDGSCKPPDDFRLIDVQELCVVLAPTPCQYVCLSYVWGTNTSFRATSRNISRLEQPKSLASRGLPRTIRDAIKVCALLGKRYLWVDRLCILQDEDGPSKKIQIDAMGDIYRGGLLTIVALEGNGSDYGLHGVSPGLDRTVYYKICIGGSNFCEFCEILSDIRDKSKWNTRGWTFQEGVLSPRLLFFTRYGLYFQVKAEVEQEIKPWTVDGEVTREHDETYTMEASNYKTLVSEIQGRKFDIEEDVVNGFAGVLDVVVGKENHRFGVSLVHFDEQITWSLTDNSPTVLRQTRGRTMFPSCSWVSIKGRLQFEDMQWLLPVASWAVINSTAVCEFRWLRTADENDLNGEANVDETNDENDETATDETDDEDNLRGEEIVVGTLLWSHGSMRSAFPQDLKVSAGCDEYPELFRHKFPTQEAFNEACGVWPRGQTEIGDLLEKFTPDQIEAGRQPLSILAYSQTIVLALIPPKKRYKSDWRLLYQGQDVGTMMFDVKAENEEAPSNAIPDYEPDKDDESEDDEVLVITGSDDESDQDSESSSNTILDDEHVEMEFLALSVSCIPRSGTKYYWYPKPVDEVDQPGKYNTADLRYYLEKDNDRRFDDFQMNVIAIRTAADGISRRLGIGRIPLVAWLSILNPTFKSLVLQ